LDTHKYTDQELNEHEKTANMGHNSTQKHTLSKACDKHMLQNAYKSVNSSDILDERRAHSDAGG